MINFSKTVSAGVVLVPLALIVPTAAAAWSPAPYDRNENLSGVLSEEFEGYPQPMPSGYNSYGACVLTRQPVADSQGHFIGYYNVQICD